MVKGIRKQMSVDKLVVKFDINGRERDNYDIPSIKQQIVAAGRIIQPIVVEKMGDEIVVLAGNRRTWGGQELYADPHITAELKEALSKVEVILYEGLSDKERYEYIYDQGSQKPLGRTEVVNAIWRLSKNFFGEGEIINLLYFQLAKYSGNERKLREVPTEKSAREAFLKKWMHGTVGNYILAASKMGEYVRQQFVQTHRAEDGLLKEGEVLEIRMDRGRITELSKAKTEDAMEWTNEKGGPKFNELLEKFRKEDKGEATSETKKRPSAKDLKDKADSFKVGAIRKVLLIAAGETGDNTKDLVNDDDRLYRQEQVFDILAKNFNNLKQPYKEFVRQLLDVKPVDFETFLASL